MLNIKEILAFLDEINIEYSYDGDVKLELTGFSSLTNYKEGTFTWAKKPGTECDYSKIALLFSTTDFCSDEIKNVIKTTEPKRAFFQTLGHFYSNEKEEGVGHNTYISPNVNIGRGVKIGHNCVIDGDIEIGDNVTIWNNVTIVNKAFIGDNTEIQSGTVIGHDGYGYSEDADHKKYMSRHFGGVRIGCDVFIGSNVCIDRGTIDDTIIGNGTKIDNLTHIAHNCQIGDNSAFAYPCYIGGSCKIGNNVYVAAGTVRNQCILGDNSFVGLGAVVLKDVPEDTTVIGTPAKPMERKEK